MRHFPKKLQIFQKSPEFTIGNISEVFFIGVGLPLKTDPAVGLIGVTVFYETNEIFKEVPNEKENEQHLGLLLEMNALMVHEYGIIFQLLPLQHYKRPKYHTIEMPGQEEFIYHHKHEDKIRKCYFCDMSFFKKKIPLEEGDYYLTPEGYRCFTEQYHLKRGYCCQSGCRHCPYGFDKKTNQQTKK